METLNNLAFGLGVALSWQNILYCFIGCFLGTLVGVLPGIGPVATVAMLLPFTFGLEPAPGLDHARRHLLRRAVRRLDHRDPGQYSGRDLLRRHHARRLPDGAARPRRAGARHRRDRLVHRRLHRHAGGRLFRPAACRGRAQVRPGGLFFADGVRADRGGGAGARLAAQGDRHGVLRHPARADRHRRQFRRHPLRLRLARARRRARLRRARHGLLRHHRRDLQSRAQGEARRCSPRASAACCRRRRTCAPASARSRAAPRWARSSASCPAAARCSLRSPPTCSRRKSRGRRARSARATSAAWPRRNPPTMPARRPRSSRCSRSASRRTRPWR